MATEIIDAKFTYNPYAWQKEFHIGCKNKRHAVALIPRQHGKTEVAIYELVTRALAGQKGANYAYLSPTLNNGKRVFWDRLKAFLSPLNSQLKIRESELTIELIGHFKIFLLGADNDTGIRGLTIRGYVIDEFDLIPKTVYNSAVLPTMTKWANDTFMIFIGTIAAGNSPLWEMYEKYKDDPTWFCMKKGADTLGMMTEEQMAEKREMMGRSAFAREYLSDPSAAPEASVYGDYMERAEEEGRVCEFPTSPIAPIVFSFDIGVADATAVWAAQLTGGHIKLIGFHEYWSCGLVEVVNDLKQIYRGYLIDEVFLPHDANQRDNMNATMLIDSFADLRFGHPRCIGRPTIEDSMNSTRINFSRCMFHKTKCELGIHRLKMLEFETCPRTGMTLGKIKRSREIHCADSFRYMLYQIEKDFPINEKGWKLGQPHRTPKVIRGC